MMKFRYVVINFLEQLSVASLFTIRFPPCFGHLITCRGTSSVELLKVNAEYKYIKAVNFFKMCKSKTLGSSIE
jgi:hypothetical protein